MKYLFVLFFLQALGTDCQERNIKAVEGSDVKLQLSLMTTKSEAEFGSGVQPNGLGFLSIMFARPAANLNAFVDSIVMKAKELTSFDPKPFEDLEVDFVLLDSNGTEFEGRLYNMYGSLTGLASLFRSSEAQARTIDKNTIIEAELGFKELLMEQEVHINYKKDMSGRALGITDHIRFKLFLLVNPDAKTIKLDHLSMITNVSDPEVRFWAGLEKVDEFIKSYVTGLIINSWTLKINAMVKSTVGNTLEYAIRYSDINKIIEKI